MDMDNKPSPIPTLSGGADYTRGEGGDGGDEGDGTHVSVYTCTRSTYADGTSGKAVAVRL